MVLLVELGVDCTVVDDHGRGVLQLAKNAEGDNQVLYNWLKGRFPDLPETSGKGRRPEEKSRGVFSYAYREVTGPNHKGGKGIEESAGYEPQDWWDSSGSSQWEQLPYEGRDGWQPGYWSSHWHQ